MESSDQEEDYYHDNSNYNDNSESSNEYYRELGMKIYFNIKDYCNDNYFLFLDKSNAMSIFLDWFLKYNTTLIVS
jgi:hypothetical protein